MLDFETPRAAPPDNPRFRRGKGQRYVPDVVERARTLVEGTVLPYKAIAARTGLGVTTLHRWAHRHGWVRPDGAAGWLPLVAVERSGLGPRFRDAFLAVAAAADTCRAPLGGQEQEPFVGIARSARREAGRFGRPGSPRPPGIANGPTGLVRLSAAPDKPGRVRDAAAVEEARRLVEGTWFKRRVIAARLGISVKTLSTWTQENGWTRPLGAPSPYGGPKPGRRGLAILATRALAAGRLTAVETRIDALLFSGEATAADLSACLAGLVAARDTLARRTRGRAGASEGRGPSSASQPGEASCVLRDAPDGRSSA